MAEQCRLCRREGAAEELLAGCCSRCEKILFEGGFEQVVA